MDETGTMTGAAVPSEPQNRPLPRYEERSYQFMKRTLDILLVSAALLILFPVFLVIAVMIAVTDGFPIHYLSPRIGQGGKVFKMYKFRTMRRNADQLLKDLLESDEALRLEFEETYKLKKDPRILPFGHFLRKTSLDELPQLLNVLKGEMSVVGPRPMLLDEPEKYGERINTYVRMKPGCAGLWQCSGRSDVSYDERVRLNDEYYWTTGFRTDLKLLWRTVVSMLAGRGAY